MKRRLLLGVVPAVSMLTAFVACNGQTLDLGDDASRDGADGGSSAPSGEAGLSVVAPDATPLANADAAADQETWVGYVESYKFQSGSDAIKLTFTEVGDGTITGHAYFGGLPPYPPATDPDVGYPVATTVWDEADPDSSLEGFLFSLRGSTLQNQRLQASVLTTEEYAGWCALQTSYQVKADQPIYGCLPDDGFTFGGPACTLDPADAASIPVSCAKLALCDMPGVCDCSASGCTNRSAAATTGDVLFDLAIEGNNADGSLALGTMLTVHLAKQ